MSADIRQTTLSAEALKARLTEFERELREAELAESGVRSYIDQSLRFIRWLSGEYRPRNAPGPDLSSNGTRTSWSVSDLHRELDRFRNDLEAAKLRPLAIQTYIATSGAFVRWLDGTYSPKGARRTSHENAAVDALIEAIGPTSAEIFRGYRPENRLPVPGWELTALQQFQFGDLRLEIPDLRVVVEVESAGGVTNLAKYWPLLENTLDDKRFVLIHLFRVSSAGDYIAHRQLWSFIVERMTANVRRRHAWKAFVATYGPAGDSDALNQTAQAIRGELEAGGG